MTIIIHLPCYYETELTITSENLSASLFHSNWMQKSKQFKMAMKIFMENAKQPIVISTVATFNQSLENFLRIMNSAYSVVKIKLR